jgi:hypothetical protein
MPGPRVYTVDEANALVPQFEAAFGRLDALRDSLRQTKIKLTALEMIWGSKVNSTECPDHAEGQHLVHQLKELEEGFQVVLHELGELSATVKDVEAGLVDLYHVRDGHLVFLCWKRGEERFAAWHDVDAGFAGRQALE